jgi:putative endonuclease
MNYAVYILFSGKIDKFYVGHTADLSKRLKEHNNAQSQFTSTGIPWQLIHSFECADKVEAVRLELTIKKRGIKRYLQDRNIF